jgi:hypothetical protein
LGAGAVGETVEPFEGLAFESAAVEKADAKKKIPASAIPLSIGVLLWCRLRGWRRLVRSDEPDIRDDLRRQQPALHREIGFPRGERASRRF